MLYNDIRKNNSVLFFVDENIFTMEKANYNNYSAYQYLQSVYLTSIVRVQSENIKFCSCACNVVLIFLPCCDFSFCNINSVVVPHVHVHVAVGTNVQLDGKFLQNFLSSRDGPEKVKKQGMR